MSHEILQRIYAGLIGMDAGMRLGAPVENPFWTYERLQEYYGDIRGYLRSCRYHTADDDVNGPIIFLRALTDRGAAEPLTAEAAGEAWLNYARRGRGMFWWGGEEQSTEHRAYMNLKRGVKAPASGSIELNGKDMAEQIGGQIFIDTWGLICPGEPEKAAEYARTAASVSHGGSALDGAAFCAACAAAAFTAKSLDEVLDAGLRVIPAEGDYAKVVRAVRAFHAEHPGEENFRACRDYIDSTWENPLGYHIIPNAGICILAMLYGEGDLGRSIEISVMCGYDTDCNASTIGTILGVFGGLDGVPERYRRPINDSVILSSVSGYLNVVDLAQYAKELYQVVCERRGEALPEDILLPRKGELLLDFALPGSTHAIEMSDWAGHNLRHVRTEGHDGAGCLEIMIDGKRTAAADLFLKGNYARRDLHEERYEPVFSPLVYPGQTVSCWMKSVQAAPAAVIITPFVTCMADEHRLELPSTILQEGEWTQVSFVIPPMGGDSVHNFGWNLHVKPDEDPWVCGKVFVDDIRVNGDMDYTIAWSKQKLEFEQPTPFSLNDCDGTLVGNRLRLVMPEDELSLGAQAFTGNYYMRRTSVCASVEPVRGGSAMLLLRGQGTRRYYALGLCEEGRAAIVKYEDGIRTELAAAACPQKAGHPCVLQAEAQGAELRLLVDGKVILTASDSSFAYGMPGLAMDRAGEALFGDVRITGSC